MRNPFNEALLLRITKLSAAGVRYRLDPRVRANDGPWVFTGNKSTTP
jgi:hypothetical protein